MCDRPWVKGSGVGAVARLLTVAGFMSVAGCSEDRDRPDPTGLGFGQSDLRVTLVAPDEDESFLIAGREVKITVQGAEEGNRLEGLGYEVRRNGFLRTLDSGEKTFPPTDQAQESFTFVPPDTLPNSTQLLIRGFAVGQGGVRALTDFREILVLHCPENATWC